jgi:hypothetical protein
MDDKQKQKFKDILDWIHGSNEFVYSKNVSTQKLYDWLNNDKVLERSGDELKKFFKNIDKFKYLKHLYDNLNEEGAGKFDGIAGLFCSDGKKLLGTTIGFLNKLTSYLNDENLLKIKKTGNDSEQKYKLISKLELLPKKVYDYALKELNEENVSITKSRSSITIDFKDIEQATQFFSNINDNPEIFPNVKLVLETKRNNHIDYSNEAFKGFINGKTSLKIEEIKKDTAIDTNNKKPKQGGTQLRIFD